jgi:formate dehydrogenase subunit gamma
MGIDRHAASVHDSGASQQWEKCVQSTADQLAAHQLADSITAIVARHGGREGPLLPILHEVQENFGHVPPAAIPVIAKGLNLSRAEVHGVVTFYHDYREAPAGRHVLKVCRAEACQSMGGEELAARLERELQVKFGETADDGSVTLEKVFCLGLCACAPAAMLDGKVIGRLDAGKVDAIAAAVRA